MNDVDIDGGRLTGRNADVGLHSGQSLRLPMSTESQLREKLQKIEALFAGARTAGERLAAEAALERVRARLGEPAGRIRRLRCSSRCLINGRAICFLRCADAMV
jgi:hypothetical protein